MNATLLKSIVHVNGRDRDMLNNWEREIIVVATLMSQKTNIWLLGPNSVQKTSACPDKTLVSRINSIDEESE